MAISDTLDTGTRGAKPFLLSDDDLDRFAARAADYDREARFFTEDLDELRELGYLSLNVPESFGGGGRGLLETAREQRRLAYRSTATALAINMHLYWTGTAADRHRAGDHGLDWLLEEAVAGRVFAAGHGEPGNDLAVDDSKTRADPEADGGYRFTGHKIFGSLSPAWDWFGVHGRDESDPENPKIVHAFLRRGADGIRIEETWDTLGLRATRSEDTHLDAVRAEPAHVIRALDATVPSVADPFIVSLFAWSLVGISSVYHGLSQRAFDVAVAHTRRKTSLRFGGAHQSEDPFVQTEVAQLALLLQQLEAVIERVAGDWDDDAVDLGDEWAARFVGAKELTAQTTRRVVELATLIVGGGSLFKGHELERIYRDAPGVSHHPAQTSLAHSVLAATTYATADAGRPPSGARVRVGA